MADVAADACRKAEGNTTSVISPQALEAVRRIDALFEIERRAPSGAAHFGRG